MFGDRSPGGFATIPRFGRQGEQAQVVGLQFKLIGY
jgi:hypothetical protein